MFSEVEQNTEIVVAAEHAARKISRTHIMELHSTSNAINESSSTRCTMMAQQNEEVTVHHGPHGILLNCRRITAIGQYSVPQAGYLNVPQALLSGSSYIGYANPLIALNNQSHIINMNIERPVPNNINAANFMCMNNMDLNNNPGYLNTQIVIMPQLINNQIRQPLYISNTGNAIAAPMIQSREPEVVVLSDDSDENGKRLALPSDGNSDNNTSQEQISLQNSVKNTDYLDRNVRCVSNTMMDSNDESNGLSEFITISKSNNTISREIQDDSEDVMLNINENLSISKSNDNISNIQTLSPLSESSNLSRASKSTKLSSSPSTLSLNHNDSFLSRTSCSQQCDKRFSEMLTIESNVNFNKSKDNVLAKKQSFEDIQDFSSERSEESNDDQSCVDLESQTSYTVDDTMSTVENKVADDLVEILTGLDSSSEEDRWLIHSEKVMRTMSEQPDLTEYNFDCDNTSVYTDENEETEERNSESKSEEEDVLCLKTLSVRMEPSEYKKDACYFKEFLKLDYVSIYSQESKLSTEQENTYRDGTREDGDVSSEETNMDLRLDSCYHGLFKRNVMRPSILNPSYSNQTLLENDIRTMFISVKHERDIRRKRNKKGKKVILRAPANIITENRLDKISSTKSSKRTTKNPVLSTDSNNLVTPFTFSGVNQSTAIADNSNVKKRTSQLHELRNQSNPYSRSSRPSLKKRPRKRNSVEYKMEDSLVNQSDDFLQYSSQDVRRLEQENHSQSKVANREKLGQRKSDNSKNSLVSTRRLQDLVSEANFWLQDTTIRGRTRSQSRSKQKEVNEKKDSRRNSHDTISTSTVVEAPKNKSKQSKSESPKIRSSRKSDGPKKSVAKKIKKS